MRRTEQEEPGFAPRVALSFLAPARLFATFGPRPPWVDVLAVSTAVALLTAAARPAEFFLEQVEEPVNRRGQPVEITSSPAEVVRYGRYLAMLSALVGHPLIAFAMAGVVTLLFTIVGRGNGDFRQYLAVSAHTLLIPALGAVMLLLAGRLVGARLESDLAALTGLRHGLAGRVLEAIQLFHLWAILVLAAGVAALDGRRSFAAAAAVLLVLYVGLGLVTATLG